MFNLEEADIVVSLPLTRLGAPDKIIWRVTKDGNFSVKSTYHLEIEKSRSTVGESSISGKEKPFWQALWKLKVPRIIKQFIWRAFTDLLPTLINLWEKNH